jgi:hypothetical protein
LTATSHLLGSSLTQYLPEHSLGRHRLKARSFDWLWLLVKWFKALRGETAQQLATVDTRHPLGFHPMWPHRITLRTKC